MARRKDLLVEMLPYFPAYNFGNYSPMYTEFFCQFSSISRSIITTNLSNLFIRKFRSLALFATKLPIFNNFISYIVRICTQKKMYRIYATRIIALMKNLHPNLNFSKMNHPGCAMGQPKPSIKIKPPIPLLLFFTDPFPTRMEWNHSYFIEKSFFKCFHDFFYNSRMGVCHQTK